MKCCHCKHKIKDIHFQHASGSIVSCYDCYVERFGDDWWKKCDDRELAFDGPPVGEAYEERRDRLDLMDAFSIEIE